MRTAKTLIRLGRCPGWSESLLDAHSFCWFCHVAAQISALLTFCAVSFNSGCAAQLDSSFPCILNSRFWLILKTERFYKTPIYHWLSKNLKQDTDNVFPIKWMDNGTTKFPNVSYMHSFQKKVFIVFFFSQSKVDLIWLIEEAHRTYKTCLRKPIVVILLTFWLDEGILSGNDGTFDRRPIPCHTTMWIIQVVPVLYWRQLFIFIYVIWPDKYISLILRWTNQVHMSHVMRLWHFSSFEISFFKRTCAAIQCG